MNYVTVSKGFNDLMARCAIFTPYTNRKHGTYAENTILIHYKPITFLTIIVLDVKMSIIQIYTYVHLSLLSVKFLISFLMPYLKQRIFIYILYLFLYLFLTHQTNFLTNIIFIRIFNIAGPTMITVVFFR